ncbi:hypothetical protein EYF80_051553 [Liparis tanakae]|uniref:Uncharacterized protein n=1 Tax=Liparis tanakae TaxID=230148 RepID=A0A4Z2FBK7_9TELE|nr:hypothetical protein EYF80_051553 [Liparis tanakae]
MVEIVMKPPWSLLTVSGTTQRPLRRVTRRFRMETLGGAMKSAGRRHVSGEINRSVNDIHQKEERM